MSRLAWGKLGLDDEISFSAGADIRPQGSTVAARQARQFLPRANDTPRQPRYPVIASQGP